MSTTLNRIYTVSLPYLYRIYTVLYRTVTHSTALNRGLTHLYRNSTATLPRSTVSVQRLSMGYKYIIETMVEIRYIAVDITVSRG